MILYEIILLGEFSAKQKALLEKHFAELSKELGLSEDAVGIQDRTTLQNLSIHAATVGAYFANGKSTDVSLVDDLIRQGVPIIPVLGPDQKFDEHIPAPLRAINGIILEAKEDDLADLSIAMMECVGLLRQQRRVFISYRRTESEAAAVQLFNELSAKGFTAFLDTHSIRPGKDFQDELWHQMCDCDVVAMLDTATYFESRWTREEIAKARAKNLQILRIIWPGITPSRLSELSETIYLKAPDLQASNGPLVKARIDEAIAQIEWLRSRSIASRHRLMTDLLRTDVTKIGGSFDAVGTHRAVSIRLLNNKSLSVYPVVGVPTAEILHDIYRRSVSFEGTAVLLYDEVGLKDAWTEHLTWLGDQIPRIRWIKVTRIAWSLAEMEN